MLINCIRYISLMGSMNPSSVLAGEDSWTVISLFDCFIMLWTLWSYVSEYSIVYDLYSRLYNMWWFYCCFATFGWSTTFDSRSELVFNGVFLGRIDVFFSDLKVVKCLSKNEIRSKPLSCSVCFGIFNFVPLIYDSFVL
jgi:hypothetical protein